MRFVVGKSCNRLVKAGETRKMTTEDVAQILGKILGEVKYTGQQPRDLYRQMAKSIAKNPALATFFANSKVTLGDKMIAGIIESWRKNNSFCSVHNLPVEIDHELQALMKGERAMGAVGNSIVEARPGFAKSESGTFDIETKDVGIKVEDHAPNLEVYVYHPLENIGRRGKTVEIVRYALWNPSRYSGRQTAWGPTLLNRLKAKKGASREEIMRIIRSTLQEAEKESIEQRAEHPAKMYEPVTYTEKGSSSKLPDPSTATSFEDRKGPDISVRFKKPNVWIYSKADQAKYEGGHMQVYVTVNWAYAKKVNQIADDLIKLQGLAAVEKALIANKIKSKHHSYMDPMFQ